MLAPDVAAALSRAVTATLTAIHGGGQVAAQLYETSVARFVAGLVFGPSAWSVFAVNTTNVVHNSDQSPFAGIYVQSEEMATPFEIWLAQWLDEVLQHATCGTRPDRCPSPLRSLFVGHDATLQVAHADAAYGWQHPLAVSNWPGTDPLVQPLEPPAPTSVLDWMSVDATHLRTTPAWAAGYFVSTQARPFTPAFLTWTPTAFPDQWNVTADPDVHTPSDPYATYLERLGAYYLDAYPLVITDAGLSTALGSAGRAGTVWPGGGFLDETVAGHALQVLVQTMAARGIAGAILGTVQDEWSRAAWNVQPFAGRPARWANMLSSDAHLGALVAVEPSTPILVDGFADDWDADGLAWRAIVHAQGTASPTTALARVGLAHDAAYAYILVERQAASGPWSSADDLLVSFDTVPSQGAATWSALPPSPAAAISFGHAADLLVRLVNGTLTVFVRHGPAHGLGWVQCITAPSWCRLFVVVIGACRCMRPPTRTPSCMRRPLTV